jgi:anti-sigma factor RsiW
MIEEKYIELIQADVDGELPEQHRADLSRYLLANPEARALGDELRQLCRVLGQVPAAEPPPGIRDSILAAVRLPAAKAGTAPMRAGGAPFLRWRMAAAFAGGLLVSAIAFQLGLGHQAGLDVSEVAGTMASQDPVVRSEAVDTVDVSLDQARGKVSLFRSPTMRVVQFDLAVQQQIEVVVMHDGQEARFSGLGQAVAAGNQRYALVLEGPGQAGSAIDIRFLAGGVEIHRDQLEVPATR